MMEERVVGTVISKLPKTLQFIYIPDSWNSIEDTST